MSVPRLDEFPPTEHAAAELEVLSSGHEDVYALWDIAAGVNSAVPGLAPARVLRLAQAVVLDLLERDLLELRYGRELHDEDGETVPAEQRAAVLADPASWDPYARGDPEPYHTVTSTSEGVQAYYRLAHEAEGRARRAPRRTPPR